MNFTPSPKEKHKKFFDAAFAVALAAPGVGGRHYRSFRLGCVIVDKQRIVASRYNSLKTNPKLVKYFKWPHLHAEAHAILSLGLDNCVDKSLYVVRIHRNNELALAKPCSGCVSLIKAVGIANIYYSTSYGYEQMEI